MATKEITKRFWFEFIVSDWNENPVKAVGTLNVCALAYFTSDNDFLEAKLESIKISRREFPLNMIRAMSLDFYNEVVHDANEKGQRKFAKTKEEDTILLDGYESNYD